MKKLFIAMVAIMTFIGCSTMKETQRTILSSFSDYRQYAAEGFLISPNAYTYNFESVGEIDIVVEPAMVKVLVESIYTNYETLVCETISYDELVKMAVDEAKAKGADALVNFSITKERVPQTNAMNGGYTPDHVYYVKGFCIKRK
jgi:hypothetical protein